ncbi:hypothetical protein AB4571_02725 [Vibrio breoganii]|uniref:hypothetical protein n=1 Tax=Vibrio breoganii TaxID=553239 RepID=UPI000C8595D1|nr:hypothetical protein [Vibrio breoganii]PML13949.1 hypothetical protein BCT84_12375 [Vibrio breoganii]
MIDLLFSMDLKGASLSDLESIHYLGSVYLTIIALNITVCFFAYVFGATHNRPKTFASRYIRICGRHWGVIFHFALIVVFGLGVYFSKMELEARSEGVRIAEIFAEYYEVRSGTVLPQDALVNMDRFQAYSYGRINPSRMKYLYQAYERLGYHNIELLTNRALYEVTLQVISGETVPRTLVEVVVEDIVESEL